MTGDRTRLHEHVALLFVPFRFEEWRASPWRYLHVAFQAVDGPSEAQALYLEPRARQVLYERRYALPEGRLHAWWESELRSLSARLLGGHLVFTKPALGVLALVLDLGAGSTTDDEDPEDADPRPALEQACSDLDTLRLLAPVYPHQDRPQLELAWEEDALPRLHGGPPSGQRHTNPINGTLDEVIAALLGPHERVFADARAFCWHYAAHTPPPPGTSPQELLWQAAAIDPAGMPAPPADWLEAFWRRHAYRRWERAGTVTGFTHVSGATLHACPAGRSPPGWMRRVFTTTYVDVGLWVALVAARRRLLAEDRRNTLDDHVRDWELPAVSHQDQGRWLARTWLDAIEADHRHLALLGLAEIDALRYGG